MDEMIEIKNGVVLYHWLCFACDRPTLELNGCFVKTCPDCDASGLTRFMWNLDDEFFKDLDLQKAKNLPLLF